MSCPLAHIVEAPRNPSRPTIGMWRAKAWLLLPGILGSNALRNSDTNQTLTNPTHVTKPNHQTWETPGGGAWQADAMSQNHPCAHHICR